MDSSDSKTRKRRDRRDRELNRTHTTGTTESKIKEILDKAEARVVSIAQGNTAAKAKLNANDEFENPKPERNETIDLESGKVGTQSLHVHTRARPVTRGVSADKRTPRTSHKQKRHHHRSKSRSPKGNSPKVRDTRRTKKKNGVVVEEEKNKLELEEKASQHNITLKEAGLDDDDDESASLGYYKWAPIIAMVSIFTVILIYILIAKLVNSDNNVYCITNNGGSLQYTTNKTLCEEEPSYNENTVSLNSAWDEGAVWW